MNQLADRGQPQRPGRSIQQRRAHMRLQLLDGTAQRRLRDMKALRGAVEIAGIGHRHEIPEQTQIKHYIPARYHLQTATVFDLVRQKG